MIAVVSDIATPHVDWLAIAPELALGGAAVLIVLLRALIRRRPGATMAAFVGGRGRRAHRGRDADLAVVPRP